MKACFWEQYTCQLLPLMLIPTHSLLLILFSLPFCWYFVQFKLALLSLKKNSPFLFHACDVKILLRLSKLCVQEGASGKKSKKQQQRLLRNMGAHAVVLELLQIPYEKVRFLMRKFCCQKCLVNLMSIRMWSDLLLSRCSEITFSSFALENEGACQDCSLGRVY